MEYILEVIRAATNGDVDVIEFGPGIAKSLGVLPAPARYLARDLLEDIANGVTPKPHEAASTAPGLALNFDTK